MITPCSNKRKPAISIHWPHVHRFSRSIFYTPSSHRVFRSPIQARRWLLWFHLLYCHRISWASRDSRNPFPSYLFVSIRKIPFFSHTSFWVRGRCLILTFCRCNLTISLHLTILLRKTLVSAVDFTSYLH